MAELRGREPDGFEQRLHARRDAGRIPFFEAGHQADVGLDGPMREQSRVLDDVAHAAAHRDGFPLRGGAAFKADLARGHRNESIDGFQQRSFARSAAAQQYHGLALFDGEVDMAQHRPAAQGAGDIADFENGGRHL